MVGGSVSQKVDEAALGVWGRSRSHGIQNHFRSPWRSVLRSHSTERARGTLHRGSGHRWATEMVHQKEVPTLHGDLSFSKALTFAPGTKEVKSENKSEC